MARLRFPGRPGYRFDRIGVRYSADEARQTTDPTLAIVANIHQGLKRFRNLFGDSDEDDTEFFGFTSAEVRTAERNLQYVFKQELKLREQQEQKQKDRFERSKVTLASLAAARLGISKSTQGAHTNLRKTYKKIVDSGLVRDVTDKIKPKAQHPASEVAIAIGKQNGQPVPDKVSNLKHIKLKRLSHNVDTQPVVRRPVGRPRKNNPLPDGAVSIEKGSSFESIAAASSVFGSKPVSKYTSMARQILARATKQAAHTNSKLLTPTHKVRKFVLPTKSSRSSRVIKPNKRFLEDDSVNQLVAKQPKISPTSPTLSTFKTPIFGMGVSGDKSNSFSAFQSCGLSLSPFNVNREKGFPVFSAAPQPSGTSSFMDGLTSQKPLGSLDQPLIIEGKRPRKPSLIMRMKLVEDDPADEIRLQQQLSDISSPVKPSSSTPDGQKPHIDSTFSLPQLPSQTKCFGPTKSLIAPARLFTDPSTSSLSSKSFKSHYKHQQSMSGLSSQNTVVLRQAKLQLNRTALNRSKAALARSLKAQLKREAKLERRKRTSQNRLGRLSVSAPSAVSPGLSLSQLSPFSKLASDSAIERQKSGLFEGIEAGAGSFSPGSFGSPPVTPSSLPNIKLEREKAESYQASLIKEEILLINYAPGSKWRCLVCSSMCIIKKNRKLPQVPLCKSCKKSYFFQLLPRPGSVSKRKCKCGGRCNIHFSQKSGLHCVPCKFRKFEAIIKKCEKLGLESYKWQRSRSKSGDSCVAETKDLLKITKQVDISVNIKEEPFTPAKKQRHKSEEMTTPESRRNKQKRGESDIFTPTRQRQKHRSGDKLAELTDLKSSAKSPNQSKEFINASNLDKPLSVDVGQDTDPFSLSPPQTLSSTKSSPDKNSRSPSKRFSLTSNGSDRVSEDDEDGSTGRSRGRSRGPRIKHVCRRAAMVFPQQLATFPEDPQKRTLTLSALPNEEKQQLWAKSKQEKAEDSSTEESGDDQPHTKLAGAASPDKRLLSPKDEKSVDMRKERKMGFTLDKRLPLSKDEMIDDIREGRFPRNKSTEGKTVPTVTRKRTKKSPHEKAKGLTVAVRRRGYTRKIRCRECKGCKTPECGVCVFCRDKPKFGGPGKIKKCCIHSVCLAPKIPRKAIQAFIEPKSPTKTYRRDDDDQNGDHHTRNQSSGTGYRESSTRYQEKRANNHWKMDSSGNGAKDNGEDDVPLEGAAEDTDMFHHNGLISGPSTSSIQNGLDMDGSRFCSKSLKSISKVRYGKGRYFPAVEATIQLALTDVRNPFIGRMPETFLGRRKYREKMSIPQKQLLVELKPVQNETAYSFDVPLKTHLIRADYEDDYDLETAWSHGFSLTLTGPSCLRALCYLCGSAGKHEMLYCIVCCQPYHSFCLDEDERPEDGDNEEEGDDCVDDSNHHLSNSNSSTISWCCRRCQFCHVCGHQNGLLKCHRCKDTYHPECLGPNYPTRPSHKNIWVCTKCVRCKSCGATTPGVGTNATWTYDFSLCYECGKLMDKGNFCPICHKCYSDDDWESKMVQCAACESWVHAKCEELTDEMYQLVSCLPEEVQYTCRVCSTESSPYWKRMLKNEFVNGLLNVLNSLMGSKCAQMLLESGPPRDTKKQKQIKGKALDGSKINEDENSNNETTSDRSISSSTDSADSFQDVSNGSFTSVLDTGQVQNEQHAFTAESLSEQNMACTAESLNSHYTKHLLVRHDEEIVEKCDCEAVQTSCSNQVIVSLRDSGEENLQYSDILQGGACGSIQKTGEGKDLLQTSNGSEAGEQVGLKNAARKALNTHVSDTLINGDIGLHDSKDVLNNFFGIASKEGNGIIIVNAKTASAVNENEKQFGDICSGKHLTTPTPSCRSVSENSTDILPSTSPLCIPHSSDIQVTHSQTDSFSSRTSPPCRVTEAVTSIPPVSFYSNSSIENVTKSLFSDQYSSYFSAADIITGSGSKRTFGADGEDQIRQSANNKIESISVNSNSVSVDSNSKCVEYIQTRLDSQICVKYTPRLLHEAQVDNALLHQQIDSLSTVFPLDEITHHMSQEQQGKMPEKRGTAHSNPARCLRVSFGHTIQENLNHSGEFPRDFNSIKLKVDSGFYGTVEEFSEDMVRIIQALLFENEQYTTRKKQANSMRSIFVKQMERSFPWFNVNTCKLWEHNRRLPAGMLKDAVLPPSSDHMYAQWLERKNSPMSPQPSPFKRVSNLQKRNNGDGDSLEICAADRTQHHLVQHEDTRACLLCQQLGDDDPDHAGRLLYCGQDDWIHINCALWSAEVFEQDDGSLLNVLEAVSRGKKLRCNLCQQSGATVGCCEANCRANYHFMCARTDKCVFQEDKTIFCKQHTDCVNMNVVKDGHFDISHRICVNLDKIRAKSSWGKAVDPATLNIIMGSCTVESLGVLQSSLSDTEECLYPVDFRCTRIYWSTQDARRRCIYTCRIIKVEPEIESPGVQIQDLRVVHDENHPDFVPLEQLNLENLGIPNFMKPVSKNCGLVGEVSDDMDDVMFIGSDPAIVTMTSVSFSSQCINVASITHMSNSATVLSESVGKVSSFQSIQNQILQSEDPEHCFIVDEDDPHGVAKSWPVKSPNQKPKVQMTKPIDLSGLSPSTLALLSIKDPTNYIPSPRSDTSRNIASIPSSSKNFQLKDEELGLLKIADRLNNAASGKSKCQTTDTDRSILKSPTLSICSPVQHFSNFRMQTHHTKSQSSSPVSFKPKIRPRSNSEDAYESSPSPQRITTNFPSSSTPLLKQSHLIRARSESPFTYITSLDKTPHSFRSVSLSPPPVTRKGEYSFQTRTLPFTKPLSLNLIGNSGDSRMEGGDGVCRDRTAKSGSVAPIVEVSESEDEEDMIIEDANKKSNLDTSFQFENFEDNSEKNIHQSRSSPDKDIGGALVEKGLHFVEINSGESTDCSTELNSHILSTENLQSILESVPLEVLEGENVKVVVLTDVEDLTEEDIMKLASSVVQESAGDQITGSEDIEASKFCEGMVKDSDGQQGEESTHDGRDDGANSDQNDQENTDSVDGDNDVPESGGSGAANSEDGLKESDCAQNTSNSSVSSTEQTSCLSASDNTGLVSTSASSSHESAQDNGDDDDLRKPHKDEDNKNKKDILFHDLDENMKENDNETLDTSSEGQPELVKNSEISVEGHGLDGNNALKSQVDGYSENVTHTVNVVKRGEFEGQNVSDLVEELDEADSSGFIADEKLDSYIATNTKNRKCLSLSSGEGRLPTSTSEKSQDIRPSHESPGTLHPRTSCTSFHSSKEDKNSEKNVVVDSTLVLDDSTVDENAEHSFTELSEDDVKIIDLSDSEKAHKSDHAVVMSLISETEICEAADIKKTGMTWQNDEDKPLTDSYAQSSEEICENVDSKLSSLDMSKVLNDSTDQHSDSSFEQSLVRTQASLVRKNGTSTLKSNQNKSNIIVRTHDTTTDEESDYLMLDDFSYSETNDEDDCKDGSSLVEKSEEPPRPAQSEVNLKKNRTSSEKQLKEINSQRKRDDAANDQETSSVHLEEFAYQDINSSKRKEEQVKKKESHEMPFLPLIQTQEGEKMMPETRENVSEPTRFCTSADKMSSKNDAQTGHQCSGTKALKNNTQKSNSKALINMKPCFVSLCRDDISCLKSQSSSRYEPSSTKHILPETKHRKLGVRKLSTSEVKSCISSQDLSNLSTAQGCQAYAGHELKGRHAKNMSDTDVDGSIKRLEFSKTCDNDINVDNYKQTTLLEIQDDELKDENPKSEIENLMQQSEISEHTDKIKEDLKANKKLMKEAEVKEQNEMTVVSNIHEQGHGISIEKTGGEIVAKENDDLVSTGACAIKKKYFGVIENLKKTENLDMCQVLEPQRTFIGSFEALEPERNRKSTQIRDHNTPEILVESTYDVDLHSSSLFPSECCRSGVVCDEGMTVCTLKKSIKEDEKKRRMSITEIGETKEEAEIEITPADEKIGEHFQQGKERYCCTSNPVVHIPDVQDDCVEDDIKVLDVPKEDSEDLIGTDQSITKKRQNPNAIKAESTDIKKNYKDKGIDESVENIVDLSIDHDSSEKTGQRPQSPFSLHTSKNCNNVIEPSSEEDEKELMLIDHKVSVPLDSSKPAKGRDKHLSHSIASSEHKERIDSGSDDNLHERILEKIKAESLARSSPGEEGPFKCPTCRRMYRTRESYEFHVRDCDFEVSTSDEEDKPVVKELCSGKKFEIANEDRRQRASSDVEKLKSLSSSSPSPLNEPLSIIITDEYKDEKFSPSSRDFSDDCSSVQSQDSRRSSLRRSTVTQRNAAPAHLAKVRHRDSKLSMSPDGSTCSSLLSPKSSTSRIEEKPSPKETMLEAVGLISRRSLELSPNSEFDGIGSAGALNKTMRLQPRVSPTAMSITPRREKRSPAHAGPGGIMRPSILAGGLPKPGSSHLKSIAITYDPVIVEEVKLEPLKPKRPRQKRIWWIEASECPEGTSEEKVEIRDEREDDESDEGEGVATRTRHRMSSELKSPPLRKSGTPVKTRCRSDESNTQRSDELNTQKSDESNNQKSDRSSSQRSNESSIQRSDESNTRKSDESNTLRSDESNTQTSNELITHRSDKSSTQRSNESNTQRSGELNTQKSTESNINKSESNTHEVEGKYNSDSERNLPTLRSKSKLHEPVLEEKDTDTNAVSHLPKCSNRRLSLAKEECNEKPQLECTKQDVDNETELSGENFNQDKPQLVKFVNKEHSRSQNVNKELGSSCEIDSAEYFSLSKKSLRSAKNKEKNETDDDDDEKDHDDDFSENLHQSADSLISPLRRSRRPPSKTAKLSEYLTELKKEKDALMKDETKSQKDTHTLSSSTERESIFHDIPVKRGRGRPRIYPEKERPICTEKRGRGRPRVHKSEGTGLEKEDKRENNESHISETKNDKLADATQDRHFLEAESGTKCEQRYPHRLRGRSNSGAGKEDFENVEEESHANIKYQISTSDLNRADAKTADNETGVIMQCSSVRQNQFTESETSKKGSNIEALDKGNCEYICLSEGHNKSQEISNSTKENEAEASNTENGQKSTITILPHKIIETYSSKDNLKILSVSSYNPEVSVRKDDDPVSVLPSLKQVSDISKLPGQKLRIVIRSPNVAAAHTIGELIKKTALSVNQQALDITVTTKDSCTSKEREYITERASSSEKTNTTVEEMQARTNESSHKDGINDALGIDAHQENMEDTKSKDDTPLASRSASPDSVSAAYDIQSDDFSSETSNDGDDFTSHILDNVDRVLPHVTCTTVADVTTYTQSANSASGSVGVCKKSYVCNSNVNEDDDDVVIVKAVGLQRPEPSLAMKTSQSACSLISNPQPKISISSTHSHQYSSAIAIKTSTPNSVTVTSCGRIPSTPPMGQQSATLSHIPQSLAASPTRQNLHSFMNLHHQTSPQQNQSPVMISEVSPGRFILQQQPNPRQEYLTSHDIGQSGLLLQSTGQGSIIIQAPSQSGIALQNATQSGIIFRHTNPTGLMLPPNNPTAILQGQPPILQSTGQGGLSFISLNPSNPLASTIISPLQSLPSHVSASSILPSSMGLTPLMQAATLGNQPLMISQPFIAQPGMYMSQLNTQPLVSQHSEQLDMALRQQHQHQSPQPPNLQQQQLTSSVKPSSIIIDPHAHMLSSGLNQTVLKSSMQQFSPLKHRTISAGSGLGQEITQQLTHSPASTFHPISSSSPSLFSAPLVSSVLESQALRTYPIPSTSTHVINLQKAQAAAPKLSKVDGAPAQINYMGSFDLNSPVLQSVMSSGQSFNQDASKRILELVQSALKNQGKDQIPGVEVTTAITNTPQGPKKVLRVFINEEILPNNKLPESSTTTAIETSGLGQPALPTTSSAVASLLSLGQASNAAASQTGFDSEWTKLLPSSSQLPKSQQQQHNLWSPSNTGYISIPISQSLSATSRSSSQSPGNSRFLPSAQFRRALKPAVYSHSLKRKQSPPSVSTSSEGPQAKRPVFEKMLKSDGVFSGTLQQIVERHAYISDPNSTSTEAQNWSSSHMTSRLPQPVESGCSTSSTLPSHTVPFDSLKYITSIESASSSLTGVDSTRLPTTVTDDSAAYQESQQTHSFTHHLQQHPYHLSAQQQLQRSPHKRASFPLMSPVKKPQAAVTLSQGVAGRARKQILQKSLLKKDILLQRGGEDTRPPLSEKRKGGCRTRRLKTALVASHHPLIHHKKGVDSLPQPTLEEEVVATPLDLGKGDHPHGSGAKGDRERSQSRLRFEITSDDGFSCQGDTVEDAWNQVLEKVQDVRVASRMKQLSYAGISGRTMFGLDHDAVVYLIEQLYGAVHCHRNYKFRFHKYDLDQADEEVALNETGAARSESFSTRKPFDMFNFLKSVYRTKPGDDEREKEEEMALKSSRRATSLSLPMAMRFRKLKTFAKEAVDVYRSKIHGRGLFCKRNIDAGEMVIEYAGEVIRASLTDKREKYYESKGIGCYMFRIDDDEVVDATMHGSAARFINHSCEPNCFSKVILVDGKKHIVIFAMRPIKRGEELTYDYKFPIEEVKIPCSCGSKRCRKYLN